MDRKRDIELIILEVLDCQEENDKKSLKYLKENDEFFSWKDLARYQNLSALTPSVLDINHPSLNAKKVTIKKLNQLILGKEETNQPDKIGVDNKSTNTAEYEEVHSKNNFDWGSISVSNKVSKKLDGFEEVKTKTNVLRKESDHLSKHRDDFDETTGVIEDRQSINLDDGIKKNKKLHKYVLVSALLFVVIISMTAYLFFYSNQGPGKIAEVKKPVDTVVTPIEELSFDKLNGIEIPVETSQVQQQEIVSKTQNEKSLLPKAPPELPEPIDAPLITTEEVVNKEEAKVEEEISVPPPKEEIEETEEPVFFVAVEEMPQPIGGLQGIQQKIKYPEIARRAGVEGKVFVKAFVDEEGNVVSAEIVKGIGAGCDEAALEAILKTKFTPGKQRGKPIKVQVTVPVLFKL